jgi:hypothetical protein
VGSSPITSTVDVLVMRGRCSTPSSRPAPTDDAEHLRPIAAALEHRNLDRHGAGWEGVRDGVGDQGGWPLDLVGDADVAVRTA